MIYFLSDMHLGARYIKDARAHEARVVRVLEQMERDAEEIYIMGDALDFWFEYRSVVPRGFVRFFGTLARISDKGIKLFWIRGNHDMWIFDYLPSEIGLEILDGPIIKEIHGKRFFLDHGDAVGERPLSFRILRKVFRNPVCRMLYAAIHPRVPMAVAYGWSAGSRKAGPDKYECTITDPKEEALVQFASSYESNPANPHIDWFVFGHRHAVLDYPLTNDSRVVILGDWLDGGCYASFDGATLTLHEVTNENDNITTTA